jgi:phospholipid/cholesterol/gamma-HCH transport system permease protein
MGAAPPAPAAFSLEHADSELKLRGTLLFADAAPLWDGLRRLEATVPKGETLNLEMSGVLRIDGGAMALLACLRADLQRRGVKCEFVAADEQVQKLVQLYGGDLVVAKVKRRRHVGFLDQLGQATINVLREVQLVLAFFGQMVVSVAGLIVKPQIGNWRELPSTMERAGADAVPIVFLVNFLIGLAMAFQAAAQLKRFGANLLVADLIGISVCRELGPLMTAIVICGRSGAAFAAQLGFMQVNEEIDALRTISISPMRFLVLPRLVALAVVMPLLTLLADLAGIVGGLAVGVSNLELTTRGFLNELARVVTRWDVATGVIKSVVFAVAIALISCQQGLATSGGAEGVGHRTTATIVATLFTLILADATLTVFFRLAGV